MAEDTSSGPFDFALKINAQDEFMRRFAQGDSGRVSGQKSHVSAGSPGNRRDRRHRTSSLGSRNQELDRKGHEGTQRRLGIIIKRDQKPNPLVWLTISRLSPLEPGSFAGAACA